MQKNQKIKAHTTEATVSVATLKSRKTRLRLKQPRFFNAPLGRPLYTSSVRPKQLEIGNWELKIDNWKLFFSFIYQWNLPCDCRGAALLRLIRMPQDKMAENITILFVLALIAIRLHNAVLRRSSATPLQSSSLLIFNLRSSQFSIINFQFLGPRSGER